MARSTTTQLTIQINGREVENTLNGIGRQVGSLRRELSDLNANDPNFTARTRELERARGLYSNLRNEINSVGSASDNLNSSLSSFGRNFLGSVGLAAGVGALTMKAGELSDAQTNVMKTTGMAKEEVDALSASLDKLNTRTNKIDLLKIAEEGGRLGLPKAEIEEFVIWMDKSVVALGDSFTGGVSEIASTLGKLKMMFKETSDINVGEAYNKIGSAINELGANGVATEKNIAEFATRVGSMPEVLKPSISEALALGAAFEESGLDAEVASRAYSIVLQRASSETAEFAKVMGLPIEQVRAMINDNPLEFFLQFAEKLKGINPEATEMANILGNLKINADGANKVMGAASNNTDRFRESIALSNKAMIEGTSLTDEFNVKNENLAGALEKIQNRFYEIATNPTLIAFIASTVEQFGRLIGAVDTNSKKATVFQRSLLFLMQILATVTVAMISYKGAIMLTTMWTERSYKTTLLYNIVQKASAVSTNIAQAAMALYGATTKLLTGQVQAARYEMIFFNAAIRANPIGLVITLLGAAASAFFAYNAIVGDSASKTRELEAAVIKEQIAVKMLQNELNLTNTSGNRRNEILKELIKLYPDIFKGLDLEKASHEELNEAIDKVNVSLREKYRIQAAHQDMKEAQEVVLSLAEKQGNYEKELERFIAALEVKYNIEIPTALQTAPVEQRAIWLRNKVKKENKIVFETNITGITNALVELDLLKKGVSSANSELEKTVGLFNKIQNKSAKHFLPDSFGKNPDAKKQKKANKPIELTEEQKKEAELKRKEAERESKRKKSEAEREAKRKEKEAAQAAKQEKQRRISILKEILKAEDDFRKAKNEAASNYEKEDLERLKNGYDKEVKLLEFATREKVLQIHEEILQLEKIQAEFRDKAKEEDSKGNPEAANKFRKLADEQIELITFKNASILSEEEKGFLDLLTLSSKYKGVELEKRQKASDDHINAIRVKHNEELAEIMTLEEAKLILQSKYGVEQLNHLTTITDAKNELAKQQNKEMLQEELAVFEQELSGIQKLLSDDAFNRENGLSQLLTDEDREKVVENLKAVGVAISEVKSGLTNSQNEDSEDTTDRDKNARSKVLSGIDLLGFSADDWGQAFEGLNTAKTEMEEFAAKIKLVEMAVQSVMAAWGMMSEAQNKALDRNLKKYEAASDRKKKTLKNQLDEGYISESTYNAQVQKLEEDLAAKRAEISYKQAMNEWKMQLVGGMANTALAVTGALGMKPWTPANIALASIVGSLGMVQTGMIAANKPTKSNSYASGGKTTGLGYRDESGHEVAGTVHANEYVIPEWLRADPVVARMEEFIESKRTGTSSVSTPTMYATGGPVEPIIINNTDNNNSPQIDQNLLEKIYHVLTELEKNGVRLPRTMENAKKLQSDLTDYNNLVSRTKKN